MVHFLKIAPEYFEAVDRGEKTFEVRKNDRDYKVGDFVVLCEWQDRFLNRTIAKRISYILNTPDYCKEGYVIFGMEAPSPSAQMIKEIAKQMLEGK